MFSVQILSFYNALYQQFLPFDQLRLIQRSKSCPLKSDRSGSQWRCASCVRNPLNSQGRSHNTATIAGPTTVQLLLVPQQWEATHNSAMTTVQTNISKTVECCILVSTISHWQSWFPPSWNFQFWPKASVGPGRRDQVSDSVHYYEGKDWNGRGELL